MPASGSSPVQAAPAPPGKAHQPHPAAITIPASRLTTRHGVSPSHGPRRRSYEGDLGFLAGRGVDVLPLDDPDCVAAMREFRQRYTQVWSEDAGGR